MRFYLMGIVIGALMVFGLLFTGCQTAPVASKGWPVHECADILNVPDASYCYEESGPHPTSVIWFFHGLKDSKEVWIKPTSVPSNYPELIAAMPSAKIVTISLGPSWMLTGYDGRTLAPVNSTLEVFKNKIVPYIEARYGIHGPYKGLGHSMGGSNLATVWAYFPEMWSSVTLINPALILNSIDPFNKAQICLWCIDIEYNYGSIDPWIKWRPTNLVDQANPGLPPIHITGCKQDVIFNLYDATLEFRNHARAHATLVDWHDGDPGCDHWHFNVPWIIESLK